MRRKFVPLIGETVILVLFVACTSVTPVSAPPASTQKLSENVVWRGHDTFVIKGQVVIYTDP